MNLLLLEDNEARFHMMRTAVLNRLPRLAITRWSNAFKMTAELATMTIDRCVISLDIDLGGRENGTGFTVADFLSGQLPWAPILIHSSMNQEARMLAADLSSNGWTAEAIPLLCPEDLMTWKQHVVEKLVLQCC